MNLNDRIAQASADTLIWFPDLEGDIRHVIISLCGEVGEVANKFKKWDRSGSVFLDDDTRAAIVDEIVDVFVYGFCLAGQLGADLETAYDRKRLFNAVRFGDHDRGRSSSSEQGASQEASSG